MYEYQYDDIQQNIIKCCAVELCLPFFPSNFTHWLTVSVEWALIEFWSNLYDAAQARLLMHTRARKKIQLLKPTDAVHQQCKWVQYQTMFVTRKCCTLLITGFPILCWHLEFGLFIQLLHRVEWFHDRKRSIIVTIILKPWSLHTIFD